MPDPDITGCPSGKRRRFTGDRSLADFTLRRGDYKFYARAGNIGNDSRLKI